MTSYLTASPNGLQVATPYDEGFVYALKREIPHSARTWQKPYWIVDPAYGAKVAELIYTFFGQQVSVPTISRASTGPEIRAVRMDYVGRCKERGPNDMSAYGFAGGSWSLIFPESVLRTWFNAEEPPAAPEQPKQPQTLYAVLGIKRDADEQAIKAAYRRMAKQWHPDVCREPDAKQQFQRIKDAYDVLADPIMRRKYAAGLALSDRFEQANRKPVGLLNLEVEGYRAPLRCGLLLVEGQPSLGRFIVSKILDWQDVTDDHGRTMVSSWPAGADRFVIEWV